MGIYSEKIKKKTQAQTDINIPVFNGNPFQYSCLENSIDRGVWQAIVHGVVRIGDDLVTKPPPFSGNKF